LMIAICRHVSDIENRHYRSMIVDTPVIYPIFPI